MKFDIKMVGLQPVATAALQTQAALQSSVTAAAVTAVAAAVGHCHGTC